MKIKTDFVTNSSSSSFLVVFPRTYSSVEDLRSIIANHTHIVFNDMQEQTPIKIEFSEKCIEVVLEKLVGGYPFIPEKYGGAKKKSPYTYNRDEDNIYSNPEKVLRRRIRNEEIIKTKDGERIQFNHPYLQRVSKELDLKSYLNVKKATENFIELNKGQYLFLFEYSDDSTLGSELEQGDHFYKAGIEYIKVSNH